MKDLFFAILAGWIVYRVWNGFQSLSGSTGSGSGPGSGSAGRSRGGAAENNGGGAGKKDGSVSVDYIPPTKKNKGDPEDGEYVDYEEVK